jgi:putative hemolysin
METLWTEAALIAVAILANGFFAGSEIALVSSRISRLVQLRQAGVAGAERALRLKESPEAFLATIQIAITLVGALASAVGGAAAVEKLTPSLAQLPLPGATIWAESVALALVIVVITFFSLVVGELTPKALALRSPERIASAVAPIVAGLNRVSRWLVALLTVSTNLLLQLLGQGRVQESPFVSEDEVKYIVREGAAKGVFEKIEEELVHAVFEFADTTVREIMVPRMNVVGLDIAMPPEQVLGRAVEVGHSRIPVYRDSIEHIVGVVTVRDLFRVAARGEAVRLEALLHEPPFIPEVARISAVLREFQRTREYLALVVDEYGGLVGLVTLEDVLEEIVGEIRETGEAVPSYVTRLPDGGFVIEGVAPIRALRERLSIPIPDSPDYTTAAGFVIHTLGAIPTPGASMMFGGYRWTVMDVDGPRIVKLKVQRQQGVAAAGAPAA